MGLLRLSKSNFEDKNILITGHTGFIGSWLSICLLELGANVMGYALPPNTENDNYVRTRLSEKMNSVIGDIRDYDSLKQSIEDFKPEIIYHLAAQPIVRRSYKFPKETYDINIGGTVNIFEVFRKLSSCKLLINFTSDKCYENRESLEGYKEEDRLGGHDPYSSSKACSELITAAYFNSFFKNQNLNNNKKISSVRSGNVIGGGDWQEDRLIPDCMRAFLENKSLLIRNPKAIRPWIYVLEPIRGFLRLTEKILNNEDIVPYAWNFGLSKDSIHSVEEIVNKIIDFTGKGSYNIQKSEVQNNLHETNILILNCTKAKKFLEWEPILNIDTAIKFTCDWYMDECADYTFDVKQIKKYSKLLI